MILLVSLAACSGKDSTAPPPKLMDTGWFTTSGLSPLDPENCPDQFDHWSPGDGDAGYYWRDRPIFYTKTTNRDAYDVYLQDEEGVRLETSMVWDEQFGVSFTLDWDGYLKADTTYELGLTDCSKFQTATFRTSSLGEPMTTSPRSLAGHTWLLDIGDAYWVEPPILGGLIKTYFGKTPILLGVRYADATQIDLLGAPGEVDEFGHVSQNLSLSSWDFPLADFSQAPFLDAEVPKIELNYDIYTVPVYDFLLQITFSADGTKLGGGILSGTGDTRGLGALLNQPDNEAALCDLAGAEGIDCEPCPGDNQPYCLHLKAVDLSGEELDGLELVSDPT